MNAAERFSWWGSVAFKAAAPWVLSIGLAIFTAYELDRAISLVGLERGRAAAAWEKLARWQESEISRLDAIYGECVMREKQAPRKARRR